MNTDDADQICEQYKLGSSMQPPQKVTGGLIHKMWKLETQTGIFAAKEIDPEIAKRSGVIQNMNTCEKMAFKFGKTSVSTVSAIPQDGGYVSQINGSYFLVYPWLAGKVIVNTDMIAPKMAQKIGHCLSKIHSSNLDSGLSRSTALNLVNYQDWMDLKNKISNLSFDEFDEKIKLLGFIDNLGSWYELVNTALHGLRQDLVYSHRDLDMKNVIWVDAEPFIIDWESAGYVNPLTELVNLALDWSLEATGMVNQTIFKTIFAAYSEISEISLEKLDLAFWACFSDSLEWLKLNIWRLINQNSQAEVEMARQQIALSLANIESRRANFQKYLSWVE